jgi:hypothetical protein
LSIAFGSAVRHQYTGGQKFGQFGQLIEGIASIPQTLRDVIEGKGGESDLLAREQRFGNKSGFYFNYLPDEKLNQDYLLLNRYDGELGYSVSELVDLKSQEKIHTWKFNTIDYLWEKTTFEPQDGKLTVDKPTWRYRNQHAILIDSGEVLVGDGPLILVDIDSSSKIVNDSIAFHHSLEADEEGNLWSPVQIHPKTVSIGDDNFHDDGIMKISKSGDIEFKKSVIEILDENNLGYLVFGKGIHNAYNNSPIHLNDVQPVASDGPYWKKGDVFLSIRNLSMIILYRPDANKVIWFKQGPWLHQHDVNILSDNEISIYNNNIRIDTKEFKVDGVNNIYKYNFDTQQISSPWDDAFEKYEIRTITEGRGKVFDNGIFVEESDYGRLLFISNNKLLWSYYNRAKDGNIYRVNWSRMISRSLGDQIKEKLLNTRN